jgi:Uma2 family endonuclease
MSTAARITADEYFAVSVERDFTELIDGVIVVDEPFLLHNLAQGNVFTALSNWTRAAPKRGFAALPASIAVDRHNVFSPDVLWISEERLPDPLEGRIEHLPDLAVEVRSPSTWRYDVGKKKATYERGGLPELWLVDTAAWTVLVFRRSSRDAARFDVELELSYSDELTSPQLPGFSLQVERLFKR